ncbi:NAD(P)-dependent oxidoreductase [Mesorhizobium sp. WSM4313]|uniref:NAD(P)-dependent oxidoreductase n=1 Tax=Mesorhizobium sp. WSM4313 TaxID=2029412 RepID=UPI000BB0C866|nr:NAD(P)-dependent oxidoreductase [Mesorhizobium sp. WSM4313]PBB17379.1 2-hydroxy-3-oxopropionate reductase [Mesorhizobium sp. WSM4313]
MSVTRIGFIGTGIMGGHMARRLAQAGFAVTVWNRSPGKAEALKRFGLNVVAEAAEAARYADVVVAMLSSGPVCDEVLFGANALTDSMQPGSTLVVMSSIPVETARRQGELATQKGIRYVDAPVSGGEKGADEGTLAIMAGCEADTVEALKPVFAALGRVTHVGSVGAGSLAKLANQLIVASNICAVAEALLLAERGGADPARLHEALLGGFADSAVFRHHGQRMIEADFVPGGPAKYQIKDTGTALALAASLGLTLPVATEVDRIFRSLVDKGGGDLDHSAAIIELRRMNPR